jgi:hypothetical protein
VVGGMACVFVVLMCAVYWNKSDKEQYEMFMFQLFIISIVEHPTIILLENYHHYISVQPLICHITNRG